MIEIIDVTLRDGGHAVDFGWPIDFARSYYETLSTLPQVKTIELGYWGQTSKSTNMFYNLDFEKVCDVTKGKSRKNVSIMIDYHYCSHNLNDYPTNKQSEVSMIRMCSRKEDIDNALEFGKELKHFTNINVSFNIFNASNYTPEEIHEISNKVKDYPFDYIYFADTHGDIDLTKDFEKFKIGFDIFERSGKKRGFHLHDHSGMAMVNYRELIKHKIDSTDTSVKGMGKGSGNLKLEYVLDKKHIADLAQLILDHKELLKIEPTVYELITSKYKLTDYYAKKANDLQLSTGHFEEICKNLKGWDKDNFNSTKIEPVL